MEDVLQLENEIDIEAKGDEQEDQAVGSQVPAQAALLVGLDDEQRGDSDQRGKAQQRQLGVATGGQRRRDCDRCLDLCGHATARQSMPGCGGGGGSAVTV